MYAGKSTAKMNYNMLFVRFKLCVKLNLPAPLSIERERAQ